MIYVIYHKNCNDGTAAAWAAWKKFGNDAKYIAMRYEDPIPEMPDCSFLYLVDFSLPLEVMQQMYNDLNGNIQVIDHHKTAQAALQRFPNCVFDMTKCGAVLSWEYFHPGKKLPVFLQYIQDYDIWTKKLPYTNEAAAYVNSYERTLNIFDQHAKTFEHAFEKVTTEGAGMLRYHQRDIDKICQSARPYMWEDSIKCLVVNTSIFMSSDVGGALAERNPEVKFICCYCDTEEGFRYYSLRSRGDFDVSILAAKFGGGGHKNAAGFIIKTPVKLFF
jgi:oligoribonuclease NrnB/cAMP/cGMP phosphodiesterase (DHH superfamily)